MANEVREFHKKHRFLLDEDLSNHCLEPSTKTLKYLSGWLDTQARSLEVLATSSSRMGDERLYRAYLMVEELQEAIEALAKNSEVLLADALGDLRYVTDGTAITYSIPIDEVFAEVHKSNMTKLKRDIELNPRMRDKGPDYVAPDIEGVIERNRNGRKKLVLKTLTRFIDFADEILPQAGKLVFDVGNLNEALMSGRKLQKELQELEEVDSNRWDEFKIRSLLDLLSLVEDEFQAKVSYELLAMLKPETLDQCSCWAAAIYAQASDNDVEIPEMPEILKS